MLRIPALTTEYVRIPVSARESGTTVDPSADAVKMAFVNTGARPVLADWNDAEWEVDTTTTPTTYYARCLFGDVVSLEAGVYDVWVQVTDRLETVVRPAGSVEIF